MKNFVNFDDVIVKFGNFYTTLPSLSNLKALRLLHVWWEFESHLTRGSLEEEGPKIEKMKFNPRWRTNGYIKK